MTDREKLDTALAWGRAMWSAIKDFGADETFENLGGCSEGTDYYECHTNWITARSMAYFHRWLIQDEEATVTNKPEQPAFSAAEVENPA